MDTTPQTFIDGERIGGHQALRRHLGKPVKDPDAVAYTPVIAVFAMTALMALAGSWASEGTLLTLRSVEWFIAFSMCILAIQKLRDIDSFATMFLGYDLLALRWVPYAYLYAFGEALAGTLMVANTLTYRSPAIGSRCPAILDVFASDLWLTIAMPFTRVSRWMGAYDEAGSADNL